MQIYYNKFKSSRIALMRVQDNMNSTGSKERVHHSPLSYPVELYQEEERQLAASSFTGATLLRSFK
jgi:hypothetical protein